MSDEQKENRIKVEDLPQPEKELTAEEEKEVMGGYAIKQGTSYSDLTKTVFDDGNQKN